MANTTIDNIDEPDHPLIGVSLSNVIKLNSTNYLSWKLQLDAILIGYGLDSYVNGKGVVPTRTLTIPAKPATATTAAVPASEKPNPAFSTWRRQDQLLFGALVGTLSPSIVPLISSCSSSLETWQLLAKTYANPSKGHIKQLKERLRNITKGSRSITKFMCDVKNCANQLASLGKPLDEDELVERIVEQINDPDYDIVTNGLQSRETSISFDELNEKLVNREALVLQQRNTGLLPLPMTANFAQSQNRKTYILGSSATNKSKPYSTSNSYYNQQTPSRPYQNQPTTAMNGPSNPSRPFSGKCQWCYQPGHYMSICPSFQQAHPQIIPPNRGPNSIGPTPNQARYKPSKPRVYSAIAPQPNPTGWLLDSGASHHITTDLDNLSFHGPYDGSDELIIGDGHYNGDTNISREK